MSIFNAPTPDQATLRATPLVQRFARNTAGRDLVVGDIHGHFTKLQAALDAVGFDPAAGDRLFSVGDLVDRGPESALTLDWLAQPWFHAVAGNHEDMLLTFAGGLTPAGYYAGNGGAWFIDMTPRERRPFIDALVELPLAIELETDLGLLGIAHADCPLPSWPDFIAAIESAETSSMERDHLCSMAQWSRNRADNLFAGDVAGVRAVIVGHTPLERHTSLGNVHFIDTGAWLGQPALRPFCIIDAATLMAADHPLPT